MNQNVCLQKLETNMRKLDSLIQNIIAQNVFVLSSILFLLFVVMHDSKDGGDTVEAFIFLGVMITAIYINNLLIAPLFKTQKTLFFFFFFLNIVTLSVFTMFLIIDEPTLQKSFNFFGNFLLAVVFGSSLKMARDSFVKNQKGKEAELQLLKAQLNPHFLFNTLNNLYGLAVLKSDKLPGLMLQLSDLLRYSLYETKEIFVPLEKEISYLKSYISLEKIRLEEQTDINFTCNSSIAGKEVAPMLFIVFVENAFKHLGNTKEQESIVNVELKIVDNKLIFFCENSFDSSKLKEENLEKGKSGIGLVNAKKRLELLYLNTSDLSIEKENELFKVQLTLVV